MTSLDHAAANANPMRRVFTLRDFRLLFAGATTSLLGDQFALIAMPWLVLQLTGDPLKLGVVLALEGIPRAVWQRGFYDHVIRNHEDWRRIHLYIETNVADLAEDEENPAPSMP